MLDLEIKSVKGGVSANERKFKKLNSIIAVLLTV